VRTFTQFFSTSVGALVLLGSLAPTWAADGPGPAALTFAEKCATCHSIGGGRKVGPDLLGVNQRRTQEWVENFIKSPSTAIDGGDPVANQLFKEYGIRMPELGLNASDISGLWAYLSACTEKGGCQPVSLGPKWGTDGNADEIASGKALFFGENRFAKGGAPCFICHNVRDAAVMGGGTLGPDLTFVYARLGERDLEPQLAGMTTPVMNAVYAATPLTDTERFELKSYFAQLSRNGTPSRKENNFLWLGLEGMGLALGGFVLAWGRNRSAKNNQPKGKS